MLSIRNFNHASYNVAYKPRKKRLRSSKFDGLYAIAAIDKAKVHPPRHRLSERLKLQRALNHEVGRTRRAGLNDAPACQ
jgi:hypothetical protein